MSAQTSYDIRQGKAYAGLIYAQAPHDIVSRAVETAGVMRSGYIWAVCPTGCVPGNAVNYADGTGILDSGAAGASETQLDGATWETTASAGELAVIRIQTSAVTAGS